MAVTPLTAAQQRNVDALLAVRRLERVPIDERRCGAFLGQAETALADLPNVRHAQNKYNGDGVSCLRPRRRPASAPARSRGT